MRRTRKRQMEPPGRLVGGALPAGGRGEADEVRFDAALRPERLDEFVGQKRVVENLRVSIEAARKRTAAHAPLGEGPRRAGRGAPEAMDHVLLSGPPGLGKTTLAQIIARELGVNIRATAGPVLERAGDLAGILTNLEPRDLLFIDEVHRIPRVVEEILYPAMEDFRIDIMLGKGPAARSVQLTLPPFTLVGATTRQGLLTEPLRARFGIAHRLDHYALDEMARIVARSARLLGVEIDAGGIEEIARRSRGTPRVANRLLRRVRDYAEVRADGRVSRATAAAALEMLEVDALGLEPMDRRYLEAVVETFQGGPVGIENLAVALGEEAGTLEEVYEPFLIQEGFVKRTSRGRVALPRAFEYLGKRPAGTVPLFAEAPRA